MVDGQVSSLDDAPLIRLNVHVNDILRLIFSHLLHHVLDALDLARPGPSQLDLAQTERLELVKEHFFRHQLPNLLLD